MAINASSAFATQLFDSIFGKRPGFNFGMFRRSTYRYSSINLSDSYTSNSNTQLIQSVVKKMQTAISSSSPSSSAASRVRLTGGATVENPVAAPTRQEIEQAVKDAGGEEALNKWLVDGKTKVNVNGNKMVVQVKQAAEPAAQPATVEEARNRAAKSLQRFGMDASVLDKESVDLIRQDLQTAAAAASKESPAVSLAIEYALEDAFASLNAWDAAARGVPDAAAEYEKQRATNKQQADSIVGQLALDGGAAWGIESIGEDLAVFGMDFTAMQENPYDLAETIRTQSKEMLNDLHARYNGTETEYIKERNRITGASARLINGLEGSAVFTMASASASVEFSQAKVNVSVNGARLDASSIIAVGNVIVDPLVFDMNGDGIDLSAAEEGVLFDMDGDGNRTGTGFIRGDDALLFLDQQGDGIVHDGRQLFGNADGFANGFEMLRQYDENGDGAIDENDAIYDQLMLWQEKTVDGVCEREETATLREAGIKSINLGYQNVREDDGKGNLVGQTGSFTRQDESVGRAADVWLRGGNIAKPGGNK